MQTPRSWTQWTGSSKEKARLQRKHRCGLFRMGWPQPLHSKASLGGRFQGSHDPLRAAARAFSLVWTAGNEALAL